MDSSHKRAHFVRAVLEGITFSLNESIDLFRSYGKEIDHVIWFVLNLVDFYLILFRSLTGGILIQFGFASLFGSFPFILFFVLIKFNELF